MRKELNEKRNILKSYFKEKDEVIFAGKGQKFEIKNKLSIWNNF